MHILVIPSWYPSPVSPIAGIFVKQQVEALARRGHQLGVISPVLSEVAFPPICETRSQPELSFIQASFNNKLPFFPGTTGYFWVKKGMKLFLDYREKYGHPDLIHAHSALYAGTLSAQIRSKYKVPYLLTEHSSYITRKNISIWNMPRVKRAFSSSSLNIAVSNFVKDELIEKYALPAQKWEVIPNMVGSHFFDVELPELNDTSFIFTNIGSLVDVKAQDILLKAFAKCAEKSPRQLKLIIIGDGENKQKLKALSNQLGIHRQVEWIPQVDPLALPGRMAASNVIVSSSSTETFGLTLAEALAVGRPVISTDSGGPRDIIQPDVGLLVQQNDADSLATAMLQLVNDFEKYSPSKLKKYTKDNFDEHAIMHTLEGYYRKVAVERE